MIKMKEMEMFITNLGITKSQVVTNRHLRCIEFGLARIRISSSWRRFLWDVVMAYQIPPEKDGCDGKNTTEENHF